MKFMTALAILFIALKLCGIIGWAWWLVLLPLYGGALVLLCVIGAGASIAAIVAAIRALRK